MTLALSLQETLPAENALVLLPEAHYVTETDRGLEFKPDTPIEVWGSLTERLIIAHRKLEFSIADAINFGEQAYGEQYAQWVEETGLSKRTLQNIARIGRLVPPSRRRAHVSFSHHEAVAMLQAEDQERMLDLAEERGMTRYELRDAVRDLKRQERAQAPESVARRPDVTDLTSEARRALKDARIAAGNVSDDFAKGWVAALAWSGAELAFEEGVLG
jgi:hypothetical protein